MTIAAQTTEAPRTFASPATLWTLGLFVTLWGILFNQLRVDWSTNPQYNYGWFVPVLALGLFWRRWISRPAMTAEPQCSASLVVAFLALGLGLVPIRLIEEANPEWRLILWLHGLQMVVLSLWALHHWGGWAWVKHFAFPVTFALIAIPWPVALEQFVIQNLMRQIASLTVEVVGLLDIPAVQHGNLIEISAGMVGVDEACSGVRSVQTTLLVSLFLGELHGFPWLRRVSLVGAGFLLAVLSNLGRTVFLVWAAARHGFEPMHAWHDPAGVVAVAILLPCLWGLAMWLRPRTAPRLVRAPATPALRLPISLLAALSVALLLAAGGTEIWYRVHESQLLTNPRWSIAWPETAAAFTDVPISETTSAILRCSQSRGAAWRDPAANQWNAIFLRWAPGKNSAQLAKGHRPDICLPAAGWKLTADLGQVQVVAKGVALSFHHYAFDHGGSTAHVFYCLWEDRKSTDPLPFAEDGTVTSRFLAVRTGKRNLGQQVLEIAVTGPLSNEEALPLLEAQLDDLIRLDTDPKFVAEQSARTKTRSAD